MAGIKEILIFAAVLKHQMRQTLLALFFFCSAVAFNQVNVEVKPADTIVCFRDSVIFTTLVTPQGSAKVNYRWQKNFIDIPEATDSVFKILKVDSNSPGIYRCIVTVEGIGSDTSNDAILRMHPRMFVDTLFRYNPLGCFGECKGQFKTSISGGTQLKNDPFYVYEWHAGHSQDTIVFGLCPRDLPYILTVTDSLGCSIDSSYLVDYLKTPEITFEINPDTVVYLTNPNIQVVFPDSMQTRITNWSWNFGDSVSVSNLNPASHIYSKTGTFNVKLKFTDLNGCDDSVTNVVTVKVAELDIPNLFSPNADGVNDKFAIELMDDKKKDFREAYLGNELLVYDRWGKKVYNQVDYKSEDWDGERLSDGTYFYILRLTGQFGDEVLKGSVTILRGS